MEDTVQYQVLLGGFMAGTCLYWVLFPALELLIKYILPKWYEENKEGHLRSTILYPVIMMTLRGLIGGLVIMPSCIIAARETPWETGQTMTTAGNICVMSQVIPWTTELGPQYDISIEIFLHHLICTAVYFNIIMAPSIHMIKPLYIHTATQFGDVFTAFHKVMRCLGYRPSTCQILYANKLLQIVLLVCFKVSFTLYLTGRIIQTPDRMWDLIRATCLFFFAAYTLRATIISFVFARFVDQPTEGPIGLLFKGTGVFVTRYNFGLAASTTAAIVFKVLFYAISLEHPMGADEHVRAWAESVVSVSALCLLIELGMMAWRFLLNGNQVLAQGWYQSIKRGEMYLRLSSFLVAFIIHGPYTGDLIAKHAGLSSQALSTAAGFAFLIGDLFLRTVLWVSVGEEVRAPEGDQSKDVKAEKALPQTNPRAISDHAVAARQLRMIWADAIIILASIWLHNGLAKFTKMENSYAMFFAHALVQVLDESMSLFRKGGSSPAVTSGSRRFSSLKFVLAIGQNLLAFSAVCGQVCTEWKCSDREQGVLWNALAVGLSSYISSCMLIPTKKHAKVKKSSAKSTPTDAAPPRVVTRNRMLRMLKAFFLSPEVYTGLGALLLQWLAFREWMKFDGEQVESTVGFGNVKTVLASPYGVLGNIIAMALAIFGTVLPCE
ncbi:unnamed protein product [Clonostachys rosea]|uniref:TLC domain-containing protein n=1 Tax=Bionectria ochroleuca TaxID=29856 RepID=A0ABY6UTR6_BIOOC|nr:unnamed protein product [Clonostachys rosea]